MSTRDRILNVFTHSLPLFTRCYPGYHRSFCQAVRGVHPKEKQKTLGTQDNAIPIFNNLSVVVRLICSGLFPKTSVYDDSRIGGSIKSGSLLETQREQGGDSSTTEQTE